MKRLKPRKKWPAKPLRAPKQVLALLRSTPEGKAARRSQINRERRLRWRKVRAQRRRDQTARGVIRMAS